jgi:hypothetical protein
MRVNFARGRPYGSSSPQSFVEQFSWCQSRRQPQSLTTIGFMPIWSNDVNAFAGPAWELRWRTDGCLRPLTITASPGTHQRLAECPPLDPPIESGKASTARGASPYSMQENKHNSRWSPHRAVLALQRRMFSHPTPPRSRPCQSSRRRHEPYHIHRNKKRKTLPVPGKQSVSKVPAPTWTWTNIQAKKQAFDR